MRDASTSPVDRWQHPLSSAGEEGPFQSLLDAHEAEEIGQTVNPVESLPTASGLAPPERMSSSPLLL